MERRKFIKTCCAAAFCMPAITTLLTSCGGLYYATSRNDGRQLVIARSEFIYIKKDKQVTRDFVLVNTDDIGFPICVYRKGNSEFHASLLQCTHQSCELNVGGGIYTCPCHGSEFSVTGKVLEGPADKDLKTFPISTDNENIYIQLS